MKSSLMVFVVATIVFSTCYWLGCSSSGISSTGELGEGVGSSPGGGGAVVSRSDNYLMLQTVSSGISQQVKVNQ